MEIAMQLSNRQKRNARLRQARLLGTHTQAEWEFLKSKYQYRCVRCGTDRYAVERDHIRPLYQGGSDAIANIQPLCARCNASKGPENYNWAEHRDKYGWDSE